MEAKEDYCERCGREINHIGRCLPCNYLYKNKAYFPGLRESNEYDLNHGFDIKLVKSLLNEKEFKPISELLDKNTNDESVSNEFKVNEGHKCLICDNILHKSNLNKICYDCVKFYKKYGGIKDYKTFLFAFGMEDCLESKENYIKFVEDFNRFVDVFFVDGEEK